MPLRPVSHPLDATTLPPAQHTEGDAKVSIIGCKYTFVLYVRIMCHCFFSRGSSCGDKNELLTFYQSSQLISS